MNRKKRKAGKENVEDSRSPKRLKKDNEKDLLGDSLQVDISFNPGHSITGQGKSNVPVQLINHPQPLMSNTNVFGDLTNLHKEVAFCARKGNQASQEVVNKAQHRP
ncbi:unnamed protein product [Brassica oleracea]